MTTYTAEYIEEVLGEGDEVDALVRGWDSYGDWSLLTTLFPGVEIHDFDVERDFDALYLTYKGEIVFQLRRD